LNNWGFTLANGCLAFAYASGKAKGENYRANHNQELVHKVSSSGNSVEKYRYFWIYTSAEKSHGTAIWLVIVGFHQR
jgi:hypothetical protein